MLLSEIQTYTLSHKANVPFSSAASIENSLAFITDKGIDILQVGRKRCMWWLACLLLVFSINTVSADDATSQIFGERTDGLPAAFGDFNSDELTDMFVIQNKNTLQILLGSDKEPTMYAKPELKCKFERSLKSVVPGDFNGDALMDIMVTLVDEGDISRIVILWGDVDKIQCNEVVLLKTTGQPLAIDYNKDMIIDLFGIDENKTRSFWLFNQNGSFVKQDMEKAHGFQNTTRTPHSHAFLDLNDDSLADLYITTKNNFEIWLGNNKTLEGYVPTNIIPLPLPIDSDQIGQTVFLDLELKGELDHVLPVCLDSSCTDSKIFVWSNNAWCDLQIDFKEPGTSNTWHFPKASRSTPSHPYTETITLRPGDFNMDGYPDLMVTLASGQNIKSVFLENTPCKSLGCSRFSRTFEVQWTRFGSFNNNTVLGVFYDFHQDGVLDIIFVHNKGQMYNVSAFVNPDKYDANFVKVMVVTGLTNPNHPLIVGPLKKSASVYGTNLPGPRISYITTTQEGDPRKAVATQIPQSAYFSLNLPYVIFGLGRTPNFIDTLSVQVYGNDRQWTQLIPNSQMVVIPYPIMDPYSWKVQLFVTPSKLILQSVLALLATCIVISFIIAALYWKERKEDHLEKLQEAHRFHFDAM